MENLIFSAKKKKTVLLLPQFVNSPTFSDPRPGGWHTGPPFSLGHHGQRVLRRLISIATGITPVGAVGAARTRCHSQLPMDPPALF